MKYIETPHLTDPQIHQLYNLWNQEYPSQLAMHMVDELKAYLVGLGPARHVLMNDENEQLKGWAVSFDREGERWFAMIIHHSVHRKGFGSKILSMLKENETEFNGWVIDHDRYTRNDGRPYSSPLAFYAKNGFSVLTGIRLELAIISAVKIRWSETGAIKTD